MKLLFFVQLRFKVYLKDKPGNYGLLIRVLADVQDWYATRIIPYVALSINNPEKKRKDVSKTERQITGDRLYSGIGTMEELHLKKTTYVRTIMPNRKGLLVVEKSYLQNLCASVIAQWRWYQTNWMFLSCHVLVLKWIYTLKNLIVSYCPKPNKNVLLLSTVHSDTDLCKAFHKKPAVIDFYNSQTYGVDIVNQILRDCTCQSTCDSWVLVLFTIILDLAAVNARTIPKYSKAHYDETRRAFLRNLVTSLMIPCIELKICDNFNN